MASKRSSDAHKCTESPRMSEPPCQRSRLAGRVRGRYDCQISPHVSRHTGGRGINARSSAGEDCSDAKMTSAVTHWCFVLSRCAAGTRCHSEETFSVLPSATARTNACLTPPSSGSERGTRVGRRPPGVVQRVHDAGDLLQLVHLYAERGSPKYEKAVLRWLERYLTEGSPRLRQLRRDHRRACQARGRN